MTELVNIILLRLKSKPLRRRFGGGDCKLRLLPTMPAALTLNAVAKIV
jgi:hypothetical protein